MKLRPGVPAGIAEVYSEDEDDELAHFRHVVPPEGLAGPVDLSVHRLAQIEQAIVFLHEVEGDGGVGGHVAQHLFGDIRGGSNNVGGAIFIGFFSWFRAGMV